MTRDLIDAGIGLAAIALILFAGVSFVTGSAPAYGARVRAGLEPRLRALRDLSPMARDELADAAMMLAVGFSAASSILSVDPLSALMGALLWTARPQVKRMAKEENPMMALGSQMTGDLMLGLFAPVCAAQFVLGSYYVGLALFSVMVALSWPPGGAGVSHGHEWKPSWVN